MDDVRQLALSFLSLALEKSGEKEFDEAIVLLEQAKEIDPNNAEVYYTLGQVKRISRDYKGALEAFNAANTLKPNDAGILSRRADTKRLLEDYNGAKKDFERAYELDPDDLWMLRTRALLHLDYLKEPKEALACLNRAIQLEREDAFMHHYRGRAKYYLGDYHGSIDDYNKAEELDSTFSDDPDFLRERGCVKIFVNAEVALDDLNRANQLRPNDPEILFGLIRVKLDIGDNEGALRDLIVALAVTPDDPSLFVQRAEAKKALTDLEGALVDLDLSIKLDPKSSKAYFLRGQVKTELKDFNGAIHDFSQASELDPSSEVIQNTLIDTFDLMEKHEQLKNASQQQLAELEQLNEALLLNPNSSSLLKQRGDVKRKLGMLAEALEDLNKADKILPDDPFTILTRALVYHALNMTRDAYVDFCFYNELVPTASDGSAQQNQVENELWSGILIKDIKVIERIGAGVWGEVYLADFQGKQITMKKPRDLDSSDVFLEALTMMKFRHENIVDTLGFCKLENDDICLLMEYAKDGSLDDLLYKKKAQLTRQQILSFSRNIAAGLAYIHKRNTIHRDLKSANILLFDDCNRAKIADFGQSRLLNARSLANTVVGTPFFMAPEILAEEHYNNSADIYSYGVLLYEMCTNSILPILEELERMKKIRKAVVDEGFRELITMCCRNDPTQRPTIQECLKILQNM